MRRVLSFKFYRVFNCIFSRSKAANSELVTVKLMKSYCLPFLLYGFEAVTLSGTNACLLDACIDRAMYKIFGLANKDNIAEVRTCLGLHSIRSLVCTRRAKFMDSLLDTAPRALIAVYCANCVAM